jgi:hypothetical protein
VERGGTLVATGTGARGPGAALAGVKLREVPKESDDARRDRALQGREDRQLERWTAQVPGAVLAVRLDPAHPLAFGAGLPGDAARMFVLHSGAQVFEPDPDFETVAHFGEGTRRITGVISDANLQHLQRGSWLAMKRVDAGRVILFLDDPVFRHFWYAGFQPYANAILIGSAM